MPEYTVVLSFTEYIFRMINNEWNDKYLNKKWNSNIAKSKMAMTYKYLRCKDVFSCKLYAIPLFWMRVKSEYVQRKWRFPVSNSFFRVKFVYEGKMEKWCWFDTVPFYCSFSIFSLHRKQFDCKSCNFWKIITNVVKAICLLQ